MKRTAFATLLLVLAGSTSALAADAVAFGNRVKEVGAASGAPIQFASAEAQGDNVVLKGMRLGSGGEAADLGDVSFEGVTGSDADGWKVARVPLADIDDTNPERRMQVRGMVLSGIQIAPKDKPSSLPGEAPWFFDSASVESVEATQDGKSLASLGTTSFVNTVGANGTIDSNFTLGDVKLDFAAAKDADIAKTMTEVGYPQLSGNGLMRMSWDLKTGDLSLNPFTLDMKDAGKLDLSYLLKGYTPAFSRSLAQVQAQMAANPQASSQSGMAIIGLLSQLSIGSLELSFQDASLTDKLLDYSAKRNGTTREQLASTLGQMVPQMLASLNNPEFQAQVAGAVSSFLNDPKSISIAMQPSQPIPAAQILGAAMGAPQTLPNVLQLKVTANDK